MNIVAQLNDHGVSMVQNGFYVHGFKALQASFKSMVYLSQSNGQEVECLRNMESDEHIQESLQSMQRSSAVVLKRFSLGNQRQRQESFMCDQLFSFTTENNMIMWSQSSNEVKLAAILFNLAVGMHLEGSSYKDAFTIYGNAHSISSRFVVASSSSPIAIRNQTTSSQLIVMMCLNNMADIQRISGDYNQVTKLLVDMDRIFLLMSCSNRNLDNMESPNNVKSILARLQLNSIIFKNLTTAGAA